MMKSKENLRNLRTRSNLLNARPHHKREEKCSIPRVEAEGVTGPDLE